jgi:hypothetical protein
MPGFTHGHFDMDLLESEWLIFHVLFKLKPKTSGKAGGLKM